MKMFHYFPIIRTRDSELMAYKMLSDKVKNGTLPIIELTKSRLSKKNPDMSLDKRLADLADVIGTSNPFIMDLSSDEKYTNPEIESILLNKNNDGFMQWVKFIKNCQDNYSLNIIPIIHYNIIELDEIEKELQNLSFLPIYALRIYINDGDTIITDIIHTIKECADINKIILILDYEFVSNKVTAPNYDSSSQILKTVESIETQTKPQKFKEIIYAFSSFPSSVISNDYGSSNHTGSFHISEIITSEKLKDKPICHGDYASIHAFNYDNFGKWVPRVDFINEDKFIYYRKTLTEGGYKAIGREIQDDSRYDPSKPICWGNDEIIECIKGTPSKLNPAHWISVRMNIYMTLRYLQLSEEGYHSISV